MAARASVGGRPGARFAQFKLVLLGEPLPDDDPYLVPGLRLTELLCVGESAVGKVSEEARDLT